MNRVPYDQLFQPVAADHEKKRVDNRNRAMIKPTYETRKVHRESKHNDSIKNTDVYA